MKGLDEMVEISNVTDADVLELKKNHVLKCFTDYRYHKYVSDRIQVELDYIASELSCGSSSSGIVIATSDAKRNVSPWENELIAKETVLIKEQDTHITETDQVEQWLKSIKNDKHREIVIDYLINNRGEKTANTADNCDTTAGNVSNVATRIVTNIARRIY